MMFSLDGVANQRYGVDLLLKLFEEHSRLQTVHMPGFYHPIQSGTRSASIYQSATYLPFSRSLACELISCMPGCAPYSWATRGYRAWYYRSRELERLVRRVLVYLKPSSLSTIL